MDVCCVDCPNPLPPPLVTILRFSFGVLPLPHLGRSALDCPDLCPWLQRWAHDPGQANHGSTWLAPGWVWVLRLEHHLGNFWWNSYGKAALVPLDLLNWKDVNLELPQSVPQEESLAKNEANTGESKAGGCFVLFCFLIKPIWIEFLFSLGSSPFAFIFKFFLDSVLELPCPPEKEKLPDPLQGEVGRSQQPKEGSWLHESLIHHWGLARTVLAVYSRKKLRIPEYTRPFMGAVSCLSLHV